MSNSDRTVTSEEARSLISELLTHEKFQSEIRGSVMRSILEVLLELYCSNPTGTITQRELFKRVYKKDPLLADPEPAKKALSRLRKALVEICSQFHPSRTLRVLIPTGKYQLLFYCVANRYGVDPIDWFWAPNLKELPTAVSFLNPGSRWQRNGFGPHRAIRIYRFIEECLGQSKAPEPLQLRHNGASTALASPVHKIILVSSAHMDTVSTQFGHACDHLKLLRWRSSLDPEPFQGAQPGDIAIIDSGSKTQRRQYVETTVENHVLVTRFTYPEEPHPSLTIIAGQRSTAVEAVTTLLANSDSLFPIVTGGVFGDDAWDRNQAPACFQLVFTLKQQPPTSRLYHRGDWSSPVLQLIAVFLKNATTPRDRYAALEHGNGLKSFF
jgi:hypothetical protein